MQILNNSKNHLSGYAGKSGTIARHTIENIVCVLLTIGGSQRSVYCKKRDAEVNIA
jgi:hypothetical protein